MSVAVPKTAAPALDLSVLVMAYNEADNLGPAVREIHETLDRLGRSYELVIINDGSRDGTGEAAEKLAAELTGVRVVHHPVNRGLGGVYRTGFAEARGTFVTFFPADGQCPASIIEQFLPLMDDQDMVLGYVINRESSVKVKVLSRVERFLYRCLFGRIPEFQGILMFRRELLGRVPLKSTGSGWAVLMEFILRVSRRPDARVLSVPTPVRPRLSGASKVRNLRNVWANLKQLFILYRQL